MHGKKMKELAKSSIEELMGHTAGHEDRTAKYQRPSSAV